MCWGMKQALSLLGPVLGLFPPQGASSTEARGQRAGVRQFHPWVCERIPIPASASKHQSFLVDV